MDAFSREPAGTANASTYLSVWSTFLWNAQQNQYQAEEPVTFFPKAFGTANAPHSTHTSVPNKSRQNRTWWRNQ